MALKVVLQSLAPMHGAFARVSIGCAGVGIYSLCKGTRLRPTRDEIRPLALLSVIYTLQISAIQIGSDFTSPLFVAILFNTYPITANVVSSFVVPEDRLTPLRLAGLVSAFAGVTWIFLARDPSPLAPDPLLGNSLILGAATLLAIRMVYLRQLVLRVDYERAVFWPLLVSLPLFLLGTAVLPDPLTRVDTDWRTWSFLLYQGIVIGGAGQLAWTYLIRRHTPGTVIAFSFLTPISGLALSAAYFSEPVPARLLEGLCAVLAGVALAARRQRGKLPPGGPAIPLGGSAGRSGAS